MGKYERTPAPQDELMDEELLALGVKFTDRTREIQEDAEYTSVIPAKNRNLSRVLGNVCGLMAADSILIFMCLADKIELGYGLVFLAAASAFFGARVNNARI